MSILKKHNKAVEQTPAFEAEGEQVEVVTQPAAEVSAVVQEAVIVEPVAEVQAEVQAEAPKSTAVLARTEGGQMKTFLNSGAGLVSPLKDLENAFQKAGIAVEYSTFPRLRIDAGCIATAEGKEAGDWVELQVISYSPSWTVTTKVDGDEGKKLVRFSTDGQTISPAGDSDEFAGYSLKDYKAHLISLGFEKSAITESLIVFGIAVSAEQVDFAHMNEVVALQLAPQSKDKFNSYVLNRGIQARMGRLKETSGNPVVKFTSERAKSTDGKSYFNIIASHGVTAPVDLG